MSGGYRAFVTLLDNGFMVEALREDDEEGVYNMFSTIRDSMEEEGSSEEPGDSMWQTIPYKREDAATGQALIKKIKRKRPD